MALKYYAYFNSTAWAGVTSTRYKLEIYDTAFSGTATEVCMGGNPFSEKELNNEETTYGVKGCRFEIEIVSDTVTVDDFYTLEGMSHRVKLYDAPLVGDMTLVRDGYLLSEDVQEIYQDGTKVIQLSGTDGLELLKTIPFEFSADKPYSGVMTGLLLLDRCITPMGLDLNVNTAFNYYQNGQSKANTFEPLAFFNLHAPLFEGKNCYDVLEMFTKTLRSCIFQEDGEWWFVHTQNPDGMTQSYRKWDSDFNFISSDTFDVAKTVEFEGVLAPFDGNKLKKRSYKKSTTEVDLQGYLNQLKNADFQSGLTDWVDIGVDSYSFGGLGTTKQPYYIQINGYQNKTILDFANIKSIHQTVTTLYDSSLGDSISGKLDTSIKISGKVLGDGVKFGNIGVYLQIATSSGLDTSVNLCLSDSGEWVHLGMTQTFGLTGVIDIITGLKFNILKNIISIPLTDSNGEQIEEWKNFEVESANISEIVLNMNKSIGFVDNIIGGALEQFYQIDSDDFTKVDLYVVLYEGYDNTAGSSDPRNIRYGDLNLEIKDKSRLVGLKKDKYYSEQSGSAPNELKVEAYFGDFQDATQIISILGSDGETPTNLWEDVNGNNAGEILGVLNRELLSLYYKPTSLYDGSILGRVRKYDKITLAGYANELININWNYDFGQGTAEGVRYLMTYSEYGTFTNTKFGVYSDDKELVYDGLYPTGIYEKDFVPILKPDLLAQNLLEIRASSLFSDGYATFSKINPNSGIQWFDEASNKTDYFLTTEDGFVFKSETNPYEVILDFTELTANTRLIIPPLSGDSTLVTSETGWLLDGNALSASKGLGTTTAQDWTLIHESDTIATVKSTGLHLTNLTTNYIPKHTSGGLANSLAFDNGSNFAIGTNINIDSYSRLYVFGGTNGANIDARGGGGGYDQGIFDAQGSDFATTFYSAHLRYQGAGATGTTMGFSNVNLADLTYNYDGSDRAFLIRSAGLSPIVFGINGTSIGRFGSTGLQLDVLSNATTDTDKFLVSDSGVVKYRTGTQLLSDIGGFASPSGLTTNYVTKWNGTALANSQIFDSGAFVGFGTASPATLLDVRGQISVSSGSASLPAYAFVADLNTGAFSPTADTFAITTGGTERIRVNSVGSVGIGTTSLTGFNLRVNKNITGGTTAYGIVSQGEIQSDVNATAFGYYSSLSLASGAAITNINHYGVVQGTISGTLTNQVGFRVLSTMTGATNNFGFRSEIAAASNRWNIHLDGTAQNHFRGNVGIGASSTVPATELEVRGVISTSLGSTSLPAYSFVGDLNNGWWSPAADTQAWSLSGAEVMRLNSTGLGIGVTPSYKLDVSGTGHFTGAVTFDTVPSSLQDATTANHLVRYSQWIAGTTVKYLPTAVKTVSLTNITLSGTQTVNGVALVATDRILVAGQAAGAENGVWVVAAGAWTRATDSDTDTELRGYIVNISNGTYAGYKYINTNGSTITVGTTAITYSEFSNVSEIDPVFVSWRDSSRTANTFWAAPNGSNGASTWRTIVAADIPTLNQNTTGSAATLTTPRNIAITGDLSWNVDFNGSAAVSAIGTLATVNSNVGTYSGLTVNGKGLVIAATALTTISDYGITDAYTKTDSDSRYVALAGSYADPSWITSIDWTKLTGVPSTFTPSAHTLDSHSNVTITSNTSGELLKWNGSAWINNTPDEADLVDKSSTQTIGGTKTFVNTITISNSTTMTVGQLGFFTGIASVGGIGTIVRGTTYSKVQVGTSDRLVVYDGGVRISAFSTNYLTTPTERLQVEGNIRYNELLKPNNVAGTSGQFLGTSGTQDVWTTLTTSHISNLSSYTGFDARYYTESESDARFAPISHTLDSHSNVTITSNSSGEILKWSGAAWINNTLAEAGIQSTLTSGTTLKTVATYSLLGSGDITLASLNYWTKTGSDLYAVGSNVYAPYFESNGAMVAYATSGTDNYTILGVGGTSFQQKVYDVTNPRLETISSAGVLGTIFNGGNYRIGTGADSTLAKLQVVGAIQQSSVTNAFIKANASGVLTSGTITTSDISNLSSYTGFDSRYFTETESDARFVALGGSYSNPSWITGLAWSKLTGVPSTFTPSAHTLDSHSNVTITSNTSGEILKWNGSAWVNNTPDEADLVDKSSAQSITGSKTFVNTVTIGNSAVMTAGQIGLFTGIADVGGTGTIVRGTTYTKLQVGTSDRLVVYDSGVRISAFGTIYTSTPTEILQVEGNIRYNTLLKPNNVAGTSGQFLSTSGTQDAWVTLTPAHISGLSTDYQTKLTGTGFVKSTSGTISYDNREFVDTSTLQSSISGQKTFVAPMIVIPDGTGTQVSFSSYTNSAVKIPRISATIGVYGEATSGLSFYSSNYYFKGGYMKIAGTAGVGGSIANIEDATERLDVGGNIRYMNLLKPNNVAGTNGQVLGTNGTQDSWVTLSTSYISDLNSYASFTNYYTETEVDTLLSGKQATLPSGTAGQFLVKDSLGNNNFMNLELLPQGLTHKRIAVGDSQHYLSEELNFEYRESRFIAINRFTDPLKYIGVGMYGNSNNSFIEAVGGTLTVRGDNGLIFSNFVGGGTLALTVDNDGRVGVTSISSGGSGTTSLTNSYIGYGSSTNTVVGNSKFTFTDGRIITINNGATSRVEVGRKISTENYGMYVTGGNLEFYTATGQAVDFLSNDIYFNTPAGVTKGGIQIDTNLYVVSSGVELNVVGDTALRLLSNSGEVTLGNSGTDSLVTIAGTEFKLHLDDSFAGAYTPANGDNCVLHYSTAKGAFILRKANTYNDGTRTYLIQ